MDQAQLNNVTEQMLLSQLGANASTANHAIPGFPNGLVGLPSAQMGQNPLN